MEIDEKTYGYDSFIKQATGSLSKGEEYRIVSYTFDKYVIKVKVSLSNEFLGIAEVGVNKDFISQKQKISLKGYHDVDKFYVE